MTKIDRLDELKAKERALIKRMQELQKVIEDELGGLDQSVYRQRLKETGLSSEWETLQAQLRHSAGRSR